MSKHPVNALTPAFIAKAKPGRYADGNGLYLHVDPNGAKRWELRVTVHGQRHWIGLGSLRLVLLKDARAEAVRLQRIAKSGGDPSEDKRKEKRAAITFEQVARDVHASESESFRNPKHKAQWLDSLVRFAFPLIGAKSIGDVTSADVLTVLSPLWSTKHETASRLRQRIRRVFQYADAKGLYAGVNPCDRVTRALPAVKRRTKHQTALPYRQVPAFLQSLKAARAIPSVRLALEFVVLTAARTNEVLGAQWSEIEGSTWLVPGTRTKSGREHRVPLSPQARAVLELAEKLGSDSFVFPGKRGPLSQQSLLMCVRRMKYDVTVHGMRSAFRDWAAERTSIRREAIEAALAHVVRDKTEAAYFRSDLFDQRRSLMNTWGIFCVTKQADVVSINAG